MRNRWGVELKRGYYAWAMRSRGGMVEGRIERISKEPSGARVVLDSGVTVAPDDVRQVLPPMRVGRGGVVRNPLTRTTIDAPSQRERTTKTGGKTKRPSQRLVKRRIATASTSRRGVYANPLVRVEVGSRSMATGDKPSKRLKDRRKVTERAPKGFYANPLKPSAERYVVLAKKPRERDFSPIARFKLREFAIVYGRALHNAHPSWTLKIEKQ